MAASAAFRLAPERRGRHVRVIRPGAADAGLPSLERPRRAHGCFPRESGPAPVDRQPVVVWDDATGLAVADRGRAGWRSRVSLFCGRLVR